MTTVLAAHQERGISLFMNRAVDSARELEKIMAHKPDQINRGYAESVVQCCSNMGYLFAWAMGSGKTLAGEWILASWDQIPERYVTNPELKAALRRPFLIVGEAAGIHVWRNQWNHWFPKAPAGWMEQAGNGKRIEELTDMLLSGHTRALAISYSLLARHAEKLDAIKWSLVCLDEIQAITNPSTQRAQAIMYLSRFREDALPGALFKLGLSGTPFTNRIGSLWPVLSILQGYPKGRKARDRSGHVRTVYHPVSPVWGTQREFLSEYTYDFGSGLKGKNLLHDPAKHVSCWFHNPEDCDKLHPRMTRTVMHRVTADEAWPNLPQVSLEWVDAELPPEQKKLYFHLVDNLVVPAINNRGVSVGKYIDRLALMTYAFEALSSGHQLEYSLRNNPDWTLPFGANQSGVLDATVDILNGMEEDDSAVVFSGFDQFSRQIYNHPALKKMNPLLLAGSSRLTTEQAEHLFQDPGLGHRVLIATTKGIKAITLTKARYVIIAGFLSYSPWDILQAIYRIRRPGQKSGRLMVYGISVKGTLLEWLKSRLAQKLEYGIQVLDGEKGGAEVLGIERMTHKQFEDAFYGK